MQSMLHSDSMHFFDSLQLDYGRGGGEWEGRVMGGEGQGRGGLWEGRGGEGVGGEDYGRGGEER